MINLGWNENRCFRSQFRDSFTILSQNCHIYQTKSRLIYSAYYLELNKNGKQATCIQGWSFSKPVNMDMHYALCKPLLLAIFSAHHLPIQASPLGCPA